MRNVLDQYTQPENRLTHAVTCALAEDPRLLRRFLRWALGEEAPPARRMEVIEQQLPGEPPADEADAERRGIPDAWVYTKDSWALLIESKVAATPRKAPTQRLATTVR